MDDNTAVSAEVIKATILAGTVPAAGVKSDLPPAYAPDTPEPGWAERDLLKRPTCRCR
jgi:hypothetical protein